MSMVQFVPFVLAQKFDLVPIEVAATAVKDSLQQFPQQVPEPWLRYLARDLRSFKLARLNAERLMSSSIRSNGTPSGIALANFFDFQSVASLAGMAFEPDPDRPQDLERLYRWGAPQLHEYGCEQAACLATVSTKLVAWSRAQSHEKLVIVDSPLGGTVPAYVLCGALEMNGIVAEVREFLAPRLERHSHKYSLKAAAAAFCSSLPEGNYPVIFPDEVLTGTRFRKLYKALHKHLKERLIPVALSVRSWSGTAARSDDMEKLRTKLHELKCAKQGAPVFTQFPPAALVKVDEGAPITLSSPFFWAEHDLTAGKRKVNLIFSFIDQIKTIALDLSKKSGASIHKLELMWSKSSEGTLITQSQPFLQQIVPKFAAKIDWDAIEEQARNHFTTEYKGMSSPKTMQAVGERLNWLLKAVYDQLLPLCVKPLSGGNEAGLVCNALRDLYALYHGGRREPLPRDRDFCEGTIPLVYPDLSFHEELVALVLAGVQAAPTSGSGNG
ncbi:MAG: hypothetical protein ACWGIK_02680 [Achromobacter pulmonis]